MVKMTFLLVAGGILILTTVSSATLAVEPPCSLHRPGAFCTEPGQHYPHSIIRNFVDDNFGLMKRMFGAADASSPGARTAYISRSSGHHSEQQSRAMERGGGGGAETAPGERRGSRMPSIGELSRRRPPNQRSTYNPCPAHETMEKPFWVRNQQGQLRVVVNEDPWDQYIQTEQCAEPDAVIQRSDRLLENYNVTERIMLANKQQQNACGVGCGCVQEQRLVKLLVADPDKKDMGIFVDWISVPACCICKCLV